MAMGLTLKPNIFTKILKRLLLAASMCCLIATANAEPFDDAIAAHGRGDYAQALKIFRSLASQGYAPAQYNIGVLYDFGQGVTQSYQEALKWYRLAAAQGHASAQYNIGYMYRNGQGVTQSYQEALKWYRLAAAQGDAVAQNNIGVMYHSGHGVTQDHQEALRWLRLAAAQGDAMAIENLKHPEIVAAAQLQQNQQSNQPQQTQGKVPTQPPKRNLPILLGR
jgi:TPR repeat protein